jgi:hypothetical protein
MQDPKNSPDLRKKRNEDVIRRMKSGEALWTYDSKASWFPPRPIIEKDKDAIARLYQGSAASTNYTDPTVQHIERRLKVIADNTDKKNEKVG